jgi:hypothetical protein
MKLLPHAENLKPALGRDFPLEAPGRCEIIIDESQKTSDKNGENAGLYR